MKIDKKMIKFAFCIWLIRINELTNQFVHVNKYMFDLEIKTLYNRLNSFIVDVLLTEFF
jgi:hypothetical protein